MHADVIIEKIILKNFRSHKNLYLNSSKPNVVLFGDNGSGKTNILEAISLFSPGRGMRGSKFQEILNTKTKENIFEINLFLKYSNGTINLHKKFINSEKKESYFLINDEKVNSGELLDYLKIIWITPVMEKVMLQSHSEKRIFFDRLIVNVERDYLKHYRKLQKLLKERLHIIQNKAEDEDWVNLIESEIAFLSYEVIKMRDQVIKSINNELTEVSEPFTSCKIEYVYIKEIDSLLKDKDFFVNSYQSMLKSKRILDGEIGSTSVSINKLIINIWKYGDNGVEAKNCSTGEQKSMLIAIILSVAGLIKKNNFNKAPIILIDEAMAHLDDRHRVQLLKELKNLNSQVWYTGVSKELFSSIDDQTIFFEVKNNI
jgi:DNA replication and repair protein RecF